MMDDPLQELRYLRRKMEHACEEKGQTYAEYLSQAQRKYTERLVRREPKPRLKMKERRVVQETSDGACRHSPEPQQPEENPMIDTKTKETFWEVVAECRIAIHGLAKPEAHRRSLDLRTRIESAPAGTSSDIFYHTEPFDAACDIAGRPLDASQYRQQYEPILHRHNW